MHELLVAIERTWKATDLLLESLRADLKAAKLALYEDRLERIVGRAVQIEQEYFLRRLPQKDAEELVYIWERYLTSAQIVAYLAWEDGLEELIAEVMQLGMDDAVETRPLEESVYSGIAFDLNNPRARSYLKMFAADLVTRVNQTTKDHIRELLLEGAEERWSYDKLAQELSTHYRQFRVGKPQLHIRSRAHLIAITEIGQAYSQGNWIVGNALHERGTPMEKRWDTMGDDRVSDGCAENERAGWIPYDEEFPSGHDRPLRFPGCRCGLQMRPAKDPTRSREPGVLAEDTPLLHSWNSPEMRQHIAEETAGLTPSEAEEYKNKMMQDWIQKQLDDGATLESLVPVFDLSDTDDKWGRQQQSRNVSLGFDPGTQRQYVAEEIEWIRQHVHPDVLNRHGMPMITRQDGRSYYNHDTFMVALDASDRREQHIGVHELGHHVHNSLRQHGKEEIQHFFERRTAGEADSLYMGEIVKRDKFISPYAGRIYSWEPIATGQEILSMGMQQMAADLQDFWADDPDHFALTMTVMQAWTQ